MLVKYNKERFLDINPYISKLLNCVQRRADEEGIYTDKGHLDNIIQIPCVHLHVSTDSISFRSSYPRRARMKSKMATQGRLSRLPQELNMLHVFTPKIDPSALRSFRIAEGAWRTLRRPKMLAEISVSVAKKLTLSPRLTFALRCNKISFGRFFRDIRFSVLNTSGKK